MKRLAFITLLTALAASCSDQAGPVYNGPKETGGTEQTGSGGSGGSDVAGSDGTGEAGTGGSDVAGSSNSGSGGDSNAGTGGDGGSAGGGDSAGTGGIIEGPGPAANVGFDWGTAVINTRLDSKPTFGAGYTEGLTLHGIYMNYKRTKNERFRDALLNAANSYGTASGGSLDSIQHIVASVDAYEIEKRDKFKSAADGTRRLFDNYPKEDGVYWHAKGAARAHQLWGDGVFMSLSFLTRYSIVFDDKSVPPIAVTQIVNTAKHLHNPATGLLWHAWDGSGVASWADHPSGTNEIHWGRAMGWFGMATLLTLEMLPPDAPGRADVEKTLKTLVEALAKYQDAKTGRWYQVVDKPEDSRNWLETSCSSMYTYTIWWAYKHRIVDASFAEVAKKGLAGVLQKVTKDGNNHTTIATICEGLNASDDVVGNYYNHGVSDNDSHGIGAFLLMWEGLQ